MIGRQQRPDAAEWCFAMRVFFKAALMAALLVGGHLHAELEPAFGFGEPKVIKLDWSTRALQAADLNGDGRQDLAVINNDTAQIELLYQRGGESGRRETKRSLQRDRWEPVLEDADFDSEKVTVGFPMFDLGVGDLNGDGLIDLAYSARDVPLTIRFQGKGGQWIDSQEFDGFDALGWHSTLKVADVDGDGRNELVLLAADAVRVFAQDGEGRLEEPAVYFLTGENPFNLEIEDLTGDGLAEIAYVTTEGKQSLVMREHLGAGGFGAERRFVLERPVRMYAPVGGSGGEATALALVDSRSGALEMMKITAADGARGELPLEGVQPQIYPVFKKVTQGARYAYADLDGDRERDLQVANPDGSELMVFMKKNGRFLASKSFPTFSAVSSLGAGRFFKSEREAVVALSGDEKTLGLSRLEATGRMGFPRLIEIGSGKPVVCEAVDLDEDGFDELALVNETEDGLQLLVARPAQREKFSSEWTVILQMDLPTVRRQPTRIRALDVFGDRGPGLMVFVPREAPLLLAPAEGGSAYALEPVGERSSIRESLLKDIAPSQVSVIDVDGDGRPELVAARKGFARAIRFGEDGLEMVDQFNARRSGDEVAAVIPAIRNGDLDGLVLYVPDEGELQFLSRDADGVLRYRQTEAVGSIKLTGWSCLDDRQPGSASYVFAGDDRFWYFAAQAGSWISEIGESYETELEDVYFSHVTPGDFDSDGRVDLIVVDGNEHVVEILRSEKKGMRSQMYWEIFEQNMHYQGRTGGKLEPRQTVAADLNDDGLLDFAFLIHDRIIYYLQE